MGMRMEVAGHRRPVVEVHAPAPEVLTSTDRDLVVVCDLHRSADRPGRCLVARLGLGEQIDLGRPQAAAPGDGFLPFGRTHDAAGSWTARTWDDTAHVSALAASLRVDSVTREVLVTNLSEHDDIVLTPLDSRGATMLTSGATVLQPVAGRDRQLQRPATASVGVRSTRIDARLDAGSALVWVELLAALHAGEWFPRRPGDAARRPKGARTAVRELDSSLHRSAIDRDRAAASGVKRAAIDDDLRRRERDRATALVVALFRSAEGLVILREFFEKDLVKTRLAKYEKGAAAVHEAAHASWIEQVRQVRQVREEGGEPPPKPSRRLPLGLAIKVQRALDKAETAVADGGFLREPAPLFVAVHVGRGFPLDKHAESVDRTGNKRLPLLWQRLSPGKSPAARSTTPGSGAPGGSADSFPQLYDLVVRSLDFTFTGPGLKSELMRTDVRRDLPRTDIEGSESSEGVRIP